MRSIVSGLVVALLIAACTITGTGRGGGPMCKTGCQCGQSCIDCSKVCHK